VFHRIVPWPGGTHPWGIVLLSVPSLRKSFAEPHDGYHVGIHEFAHLLDLAGSEVDGVPVGMKPDRIPTWLDLVERDVAVSGARATRSARMEP